MEESTQGEAQEACRGRDKGRAQNMSGGGHKGGLYRPPTGVSEYARTTLRTSRLVLLEKEGFGVPGRHRCTRKALLCQAYIGVP